MVMRWKIVEEQTTITIPIGWPWQPDDIHLTPADFRVKPLPWWHQILLHRALVWLLCGLLCLTVAGFIEQQIYQHTIGVQQQWIVQQSRVQTHCLQHAQTVVQRSTCEAMLAQAVTQQQNTFNQQWTPPGNGNTTATMQSAFNALYASACYADASHTVDMSCVSTLAPRLRAMAVLDATDALHG